RCDTEKFSGKSILTPSEASALRNAGSISRKKVVAVSSRSEILAEAAVRVRVIPGAVRVRVLPSAVRVHVMPSAMGSVPLSGEFVALCWRARSRDAEAQNAVRTAAVVLHLPHGAEHRRALLDEVTGEPCPASLVDEPDGGQLRGGAAGKHA